MSSFVDHTNINPFEHLVAHISKFLEHTFLTTSTKYAVISSSASSSSLALGAPLAEKTYRR